jgi:hypothetical protein
MSTNDLRKSITLPASMWIAVSDYRFSKRITTEAEAVRQLLQAGIRAMQTREEGISSMTNGKSDTGHDPLPWLQQQVAQGLEGKPVVNLDEAFSGVRYRIKQLEAEPAENAMELERLRHGLQQAEAQWEEHCKPA